VAAAAEEEDEAAAGGSSERDEWCPKNEARKACSAEALSARTSDAERKRASGGGCCERAKVEREGEGEGQSGVRPHAAAVREHERGETGRTKDRSLAEWARMMPPGLLEPTWAFSSATEVGVGPAMAARPAGDVVLRCWRRAVASQVGLVRKESVRGGGGEEERRDAPSASATPTTLPIGSAGTAAWAVRTFSSART